jgi:hypothetical protein
VAGCVAAAVPELPDVPALLPDDVPADEPAVPVVLVPPVAVCVAVLPALLDPLLEDPPVGWGRAAAVPAVAAATVAPGTGAWWKATGTVRVVVGVTMRV